MMTILDAARSAYRSGLVALPVKADGSKRPDVETWSAYQMRTTTIAERQAFAFGTRDGFGIISGPVSRTECWDFDCADVYTAFCEAAEAAGLGPLVDRIRNGYEDTTPAGGRRWIVRYPSAVEWKDCTLARRPGRDGEPAVKVLIELPTFAIVAPSNGRTHLSGRPYVRVSGGFETIARYDADERGALLDLARAFDAMPKPRAAEHSSRTTTTTTAGASRPGDDYTARTTWPGLLEPAGWAIVFERNGTAYWRRPGKTIGISATTNHAESDLLYVFSSSTAFAAERGYSRFGAYAVLQHGGDCARAARALARDGYGTRAADDPAPTTATAGRPGETPTSRTIRLTPASAIRVRPVRWLWQDRIALGSLALLGGREGIGKSICAYTIAASVTRGTMPGAYDGTPRPVFVAATEDSWEHTINPRLIAAGADRDLIYQVDVVTPDGLETPLTLPRDLAALEASVRERAGALIVLDPLLSRLDVALDSHKDAEVRVALEPLVKLAGATDACVLGLIHVNKTSTHDPLTMLMGSRAFAAVARAVLFALVDPDDDTRRLLGQPKNNLGRVDLPTLAFRIAGALVATTDEGEVWTGKLEWLGEHASTIREAVEHAAERSGDRGATAEAADWLHDYLLSEGGRADSARAKSAGKAAGHTVDALQRARQRLRLTVDQSGFPRRTYWIVPAAQSSGPQSSDRPGETTDDYNNTTTAEKPKESAPHSRRVRAQSLQSSESSETPPARATTGATTGAADPLPLWVMEPAVPDTSDPIGARDADGFDPRRAFLPDDEVRQ